MQFFHRRRTFTRGVAIVVVLVVLAVAVIMGAGLYFFSMSTQQQVTGATFATAAEYLCEAACEEGYFLAQQALNDPTFPDPELRKLYDFVRDPDAKTITVAYDPSLVMKHVGQESCYDATSVEFDPDAMTASVTLVKEDPYTGMSEHEHRGSMTFEASVRPSWGGGKTGYRRVVIRRGYKVVLVTPPAPFDKSALTLINPDYVNGESKTAIWNEIFVPTNDGIQKHNLLCKAYRKTVDKISEIAPAKCASGCAALPYVGGSPPFFAPKIPNSAKIPQDFFFDDSLMLGKFGIENFGKLVDFNYEDFLRENWPPLYKIFKTLVTVATVNQAVLVVTGTLLCIVPGHEMCSALDIAFGLGEVIRAVHSALEVIVPIQIALGQILLGAQKLVMEGFIVGSLFDQFDEALQGNFKPMADSAATFAVDFGQSGVLDQADATSGDIAATGSQAGGTDLTEGMNTDFSAAGDAAGAADGADAAAGAADGAGAAGDLGDIATVDGDLVSSMSDKVGNDPTAFTDSFDQLKDMDKWAGSIRGLGDSLTAATGGGQTKDVTPLSQMASNSDLSMLTGLIKGFVESHQTCYTNEPPAGDPVFQLAATRFQLYHPDLWKLRASLRVDRAERVQEILGAYSERGFCGILLHEGSDAVTLNLPRFRGKCILVSMADVQIQALQMEKLERDAMTIVTPGTITCPVGPLHASLNCIGEGGSCLVIPGDGLQLTGNVLINHYRKADQQDRKSNPNALKGELRRNPRLDQHEDDLTTLVKSHLRGLVSPGVLFQEVHTTP